MKQNFISKDHEEEGPCKPASCLQCHECKVILFGERREELKEVSSQLYAREAENYFFYYALNMKQSS